MSGGGDKRLSKVRRRRRGKPGDGWQDRFLEGLRCAFQVRYACRIAGVSPTTAYEARKADEDFARAWDEAREDGLARVRPVLEEAVIYRAIYGWDKDVWWRGKKVGTERVISPELMKWVLERLIPERYHLVEATGPSEGAIEYARRVQALLVQGRASVAAEPEPPTNGHVAE